MLLERVSPHRQLDSSPGELPCAHWSSSDGDTDVKDKPGGGRRAEPLQPGTIIVAGLLVIGVYMAGLIILMTRTTYDTWGGALVAPVLFLATLPSLAKQAAREHDRMLFWLLVAALIAKLLASFLRLSVLVDIY